MKEIKLLDLCCKAGGCSEGYVRAAEELNIPIITTGIDIKPQPNYPFHFIQTDAIEYVKEYGHEYTHIHASFPCQKYSRTRSLHRNEFPDILEAGRKELHNTGRPYVIENVLGAPMKNCIILDGPMFGLPIIRKRKFESNKLILQPGKGYKKGSVGAKNCTRKDFNGYFIISGHQMGTLEEWRAAMGIDWMTREELAEAIPPAYTHWIGLQFFAL